MFHFEMVGEGKSIIYLPPLKMISVIFSAILMDEQEDPGTTTRDLPHPLSCLLQGGGANIILSSQWNVEELCHLNL
jgi:hypothetical protein